MANVRFPQSIETFLQAPLYMVLGTLNADSSIQMTMMWYLFEDGVIKLSTTGDRVKFKNMQRTPQVTMFVSDPENPFRYVQIRGQVTGHTREGGHAFIDRLAKHYLDKDTYPFDPERKDDRVTFTITPESYFSYGFE